VAAWQRFAFGWHGIDRQSGDGPPAADGPGTLDDLRAGLRRLAGFPAPVAAFEASLLPARMPGYTPGLLDQLLAAGEFAWLRPAVARAADVASGPIRTTAIAFVERASLGEWRDLLSASDGAATSSVAADGSPAARTLLSALASGGALFFLELQRRSGLTASEVTAGLGELVVAGLVTNDGFAGLRALLDPPPPPPSRHGRPAHQPSLPGRWSLMAADAVGEGLAASSTAARAQAVERCARALLDRYGVVFRTALAREARWLPAWRDLVQVWRRLEARGEIRGGRFVAGFGGEQFALPEAVEALRAARAGIDNGATVVICAADPLNLAGITTPGDKVSAIASNRVLYRDGVPVAAQLGASFRWLGAADREYEWMARTALLRGDPRLAVPETRLPA
jgi:ATP-dependent Lhr-like helicase